uniref:non-specific serine/threonine protein kinase n=1 Tax=Meloidogyne hapla TaxID=6305 RepID=A0A1I8B3A1_MELHA
MPKNKNSSSSFCSASTSSCFSPPYSPKTKENIEHEDSGFLSCWPMDEAGNEKVSMENFALIRVLGKGAYGKVFLVRKIGGQDSGRYYAMKVLKKTRVTQKQKTLEHTLAERKVLERLKGLPFLVNMVYAFQTDTKLHIVMEFVRGGELFTHLCKRKKFDLSTARIILAEIALALENVHKADGHIKLTDFGLSKAFEIDENATNSYCGTIEYMSPEIIQRTSNGYTQVVDWWSFGVIAFELLTGCSPFTVDGDQNSTSDIAKRILTKRVPFPKTMDISARELIFALLNKDPNKRLGFKEGLEEIKKTKFFSPINWSAIEKREIPGPVKPNITGGQTDVENFASEFTAQTPLFSPAEKPSPEFHKFFRGYSFVSPSVIFSNDNVIGQECLEQSVQLLTSNNSAFFSKYKLDTTPKGLLGRGSFSICRKCQRLNDGKEFAVKIVSQRFSNQAIREIRILEALNPHPHIVPLIEAISDQFHYYIILEKLEGGELLDRLRKMEKFTEIQAAEIMTQLVSSLRHMHSKDIVHRDLKPENILFASSESGNYSLRLVDFGFARILPSTMRGNSGSFSSTKNLITPLCGTLHYAAPEVLEIEDELPQYNQQCDLWSLGVVLFTLLSGKVPFHAKSQAESAADIIARIRKAEFSFEGPVWAMVSEPAKDLITGLLTVDPTRRLSLAQVARHPWLDSAKTPESSAYTATELPTPTILPRSADETFNATISAFISASREGFQLMDVSTAPLLVRRRGIKRQRIGGEDIEDEGRKGGLNEDEGMKEEQNNNERQIGFGKQTALCSVPEGSEALDGSPPTIRRPTTLNVFNQEDHLNIEHNQQQHSLPQINTKIAGNSSVFTEYRDTKPSYLKYSRDDIGGNNSLITHDFEKTPMKANFCCRN